MRTRVKRILASRGGTRTIRHEPLWLFKWPIVTREDERAILRVVRDGRMSATDVTKEFEREFARWLGVEYSLGFCNGTASLFAALWACGVGVGDEVICPSMTYWASAASALMLGATVNFCDIEETTLCADPNDIEHRIGPRTKAIVVTHYAGHPAAMDRIMGIARAHGVRVIEDVSHAHGGLYEGRNVGTLGDIGAMSMMSGKSFSIGEAGMIVTDDRELYERCVAFGHYERTGVTSRFNPVDKQVTTPELEKYAGVPLGAAKHRMNQTCSAMGRVQLRHFASRMARIQEAMHLFWDSLDGVPGLHAHRTDRSSNSTMGGWYYPQGLYRASELGGLESHAFCDAVNAEGVAWCFPGGNQPLHLHSYFHEADVFRSGSPTSVAFGQRDVRQVPGSLPVAESILKIAIAVPWFKHPSKKWIRRYADAFRKVAENAERLHVRS